MQSQDEISINVMNDDKRPVKQVITGNNYGEYYEYPTLTHIGYVRRLTPPIAVATGREPESLKRYTEIELKTN